MQEPREVRRARRLTRRQREAEAPAREGSRASPPVGVVFALLCLALAGLWSGRAAEQALYASGRHVEPALSTQPRLLPAPVVIYTPTPSR